MHYAASLKKRSYKLTKKKKTCPLAETICNPRCAISGSSDYDGDNRRTVLTKSVKHIFGLAVFEDFLYWTDWTNRTVERAHKITGEMRTVILNFTHYRPMGVKVRRSDGSLPTIRDFDKR